MTNPLFFLFLVLVAIAGYATLRMSPKGPKDGVGKLLGYVFVFVALVAIGTTALPRFLERQAAQMGNWSGFWGQTAGTVNGIADSAAGTLGLDAPDIPPAGGDAYPDQAGDVAGREAAKTAQNTEHNGTEQKRENERYTVQPGDTLAEIAGAHNVTVSDLKSANGLTGDLITPGQLLIIPGDENEKPKGTEAVTQTPTPAAGDQGDKTAISTPTATPTSETRKTELYQQLAQAKAAGDMAAGETVLSDLFAIDPSDPTASTAWEELNEARDIADRLASLAGVDDPAPLKNLLYGYTMRVVSEDTKWLRGACGESATVQIVSAGWLYGHTFTVIRCTLSGYGDGTPESGETFTVE